MGSIGEWVNSRLFEHEQHVGVRQYEWRYDSGKLLGEPKYAKNACYFRLLAHRDGTVMAGGEGVKGTPIYIHVTNTGEKVSTEVKDCSARLYNIEGAEWFKV